MPNKVEDKADTTKSNEPKKNEEKPKTEIEKTKGDVAIKSGEIKKKQ